ncbi:MAG: transcription factor S [Nitrososphaera sp.]
MRFCPQCETHPRLKPRSEGMLVCPKCGLKSKKAEELHRSEGNGRRASGIDSPLKVMDGDVVDALPTTSIECPECRNGTAFWWMLQTRSADEATTQFYRCTRCNHTWRNYA